MNLKILLVSLLSLTGFSANGQLLTDSLVFLHNFDGNTLDASGNGLSLINYGPVLTEDRNGTPNSAYFWDGIDDFLEIPSSPLIKVDPPVSFALWFNTESMAEANLKFFKTDLNPLDYNGYFLSGYPPFNGEPEILISMGGGIGHTGPNNRRSKSSGSAISQNTWHHVVCVIRDALDMDIYIDCELTRGDYEGAGPTEVSHTAAAGRLGSVMITANGPETFFWGAMDQFAMWHRALSEGDVIKICQDDLEHVGLEEMTELSLSIHPNPANESLTVNLPTQIDVNEVLIFDAQGKLMVQQAHFGQPISSLSIALTGMSEGMYFVQINSSLGLMHAKFLKQ